MEERLKLLYGEEALRKFSSATVLIVGVGGVGGMATEALARSCIGRLILVDYDTVSFSNINRQIIALEETVGEDKVICFKKRIHAINPHCEVVTKKMKITDANVHELFQEDITFVLDACDDKTAKLALKKITEAKQIPFLMALGAGNRTNPSKVVVTTLDKTTGDPLARKMRTLFKKENLSLKTPVVYSQEIPIKPKSTTIASSMFVPATAGLYAANYILEYIRTKKEK